jgi:hypothetical protein
MPRLQQNFIDTEVTVDTSGDHVVGLDSSSMCQEETHLLSLERHTSQFADGRLMIRQTHSTHKVTHRANSMPATIMANTCHTSMMCPVPLWPALVHVCGYCLLHTGTIVQAVAASNTRYEIPKMPCHDGAHVATEALPNGINTPING